MAESFHAPFGDIDPAAVEAATAAAAQANSRKDIEEMLHMMAFKKSMRTEQWL